MRIYFSFLGDGNKEVLVLPSITPNPDQKRVGIRIGTETVYLRSQEALEFAKRVTAEAKP